MKKTAVFLAFVILLGMAFPAFSAEDELKTGDILCFGTPDEASGFDGRWLVLDAEHTSTGEEGIFLLSLSLVGDEEGGTLLFRDIGDVSVSFSDRGEAYAATHPGVLDYQGSDIQKWCAAFPEKYLSAAERSALIPTYKSDAAVAIPGFGIPLPGVAAGTVDFSAAENILDGDTVFLLSAEEAVSAAYGLGESSDRVALYKGEAAGWWLRSPHIPTFPLDVGFVFYFGSVMDFPVNANYMVEMATYARPACNIDASRVSKLEKLSVSGETTLWRVSFKGEENKRSYDTAVPEPGDVMDIQDMVKTAFFTVAAIAALLIALIVFLIARAVRKRKRQSK